MSKLASTQHGSFRLRERCHVKSYNTTSYLNKIMKYGIKYDETYDDLKKYLRKVKNSGPVFIYERKIFVFSDDNKLITVLHLRNKFIKQVRILEKLEE